MNEITKTDKFTGMTVRVELGEGKCGDYDPDDPNDIELLRFDVSYKPKGKDIFVQDVEN